MCVMDIMNVLRTGMNMSISRIHVWLCYIHKRSHLSLDSLHTIGRIFPLFYFPLCDGYLKKLASFMEWLAEINL